MSVVCSSLYLANSGIPLFSQSVFYQIVLLLPIIGVEAYIHKKLLSIKIGKAFWISFGANLLSTLVGGIFVILPFGAFVSQVLTGSTVPVPPGEFPFLPIEIMITLVPVFLFSTVVETFIGFVGLKPIARKTLCRSFWIANAFTYLMLEILAITQLVQGYIEGRG